MNSNLRYSKNRGQKYFPKNKNRDTVNTQVKKMTGPGFLIIVMVALTKDGLDVVLEFSGFLAPLILFFSFIVMFTITFYLMYNRVSFGVRKIAVVFVATLLEISPFAFLPTTTIFLFVIRWMENSEGNKILTIK